MTLYVANIQTYTHIHTSAPLSRTSVCNVSQAVSRQLQIAEVQIRSQDSPCRVCVGLSGTGTSLSTRTFPFPFKFSLHHCSIFILINLRSKLYSFHTQTSKNNLQQLIPSLTQGTVYPAIKGVGYSKVVSTDRTWHAD
jgi:hypothetical protein